MEAKYKINKEHEGKIDSLYNFTNKCEAKKRLKEIERRCLHPIFNSDSCEFSCYYYNNKENVIRFYVSKQ